MPVNRADITVTQCGTTKSVAHLISGRDGQARITLPIGCYEATVATVPGGCSLGDPTPARVTVTETTEARASFRFHCA
ncbi:hypothetical protein GCM10011591_40540 [Nocardia camponoti]|uniref:Uncharacterized protein n=2 Tax=Nocardia camponoti TaxID=1616106 RepID=A0A917QRU7_9NOCA|nr:hypothetical protein GCM10011591_40540 [Nocardia camponoti]